MYEIESRILNFEEILRIKKGTANIISRMHNAVAIVALSFMTRSNAIKIEIHSNNIFINTFYSMLNKISCKNDFI